MVLMFVLLAHQLALALPRHTAAPAIAGTDRHTTMGMPCDGSCPSGVLILCIPGRICAGVDATRARLPSLPLLLLVPLILTLLVLRPAAVARRPPRSLRSPERGRAFLQVFLI